MDTKDFVEQTSIETKQHIEAALAKVRGQTWSEPLGRVCMVTAGVASGLGTFVPGFGIVGGALSLGASLLNPSATMNDVERGKGGTNSGTGSSEVKEDMEEVNAEVNELIKDVQRFSQSVGGEIKDIKDVVSRTFDIVVDTRYKDG